MGLDKLFTVLFFSVFAFVAGAFILKIIKYGGFRAAMFGAPIGRTIGEVSGGAISFGSIVVRVHALAGESSEKAVGLELVAKSFASYHMTPVALSASEATKLVALLQTAVTEAHAT